MMGRACAAEHMTVLMFFILRAPDVVVSRSHVHECMQCGLQIHLSLFCIEVTSAIKLAIGLQSYDTYVRWQYQSHDMN